MDTPSQGQLFPKTSNSGPLIYLSTHFIRAKEYLEAILASTSDAICTTDLQGSVIYFSPGAEKMMGRRSQEVVGRPVHFLYDGGEKEAQHIMDMLLEKGKLENYETVITVGSRKVHISMSAALLRDRAGNLIGTLGISKDISDRVELERRLRELSITDNLTGLFNQRHFRERAQAEVQRAKRQRLKLALLLIDLDGFKQVNDLRGHLEGDRILRQMAEAIKRSIRGEVDAGFRYGGDEFVVLLPGLGPGKASVVINRIHSNFESSGAVEDVSFSCGVASFRAADTIEELLHRADQNMYQVKRRKASLRKP